MHDHLERGHFVVTYFLFFTWASKAVPLVTVLPMWKPIANLVQMT